MQAELGIFQTLKQGRKDTHDFAPLTVTFYRFTIMMSMKCAGFKPTGGGLTIYHSLTAFICMDQGCKSFDPMMMNEIANL